MAITKQDFANAKIDESFGLSMDTLYNYIANNMPASRFWYKFKDNKEQCLAVLNAVKNAGMSPALFTVKEKAEGYNSTMSWGNHYLEKDVSGTEPQKAVKYAQHTIETANSTAYNPAWYDAAYPVHCVPQDVQQSGNADFQKTPKGTIKRAYVPMTAAATWAYYYPKALNANVNGVSNYGNPIQQCTDYLNEMGAKITGTPNGTGGVTPPPNNNDIKPNTPNQNKPLEGDDKNNFDFSLIEDAIQKAINQLLDLLKQSYYLKNNGIYGTKLGLLFTKNLDYLHFSHDTFKSKVDDIFKTVSDTIGDAVKEDGNKIDELPNGVNQAIEILLTRAKKYVKDENVKYDEAGDGNPEHGTTDNARFMSWCVQTIHPSLKNANHRDFFLRFNSAGYVRHRGKWADIAKNLQIGDLILCADNLETTQGGKEYMIALGNDECVEAYPWETGNRSSKNNVITGQGIAKFKLSERAALGCADIAIVRVYNPKIEPNTPETPPTTGGVGAKGIAHIKSLIGTRIGNGQCYGLCAEYSGYLGGAGLGAGTKYGITNTTGQGSLSAAADIGICYQWEKFGWTVIKNPTLSQLKEGRL